MKQKVHSVSYLAKAEFEFENGDYNLVALPVGAEVVKVSFEVVGGDLKDGSITMGIKDEGKDDYSSILWNTNAASTNAERNFVSYKDYTIKANKVVAVKVFGNTQKSDVKCILRVLYFLPSVIEVEY